MSYAIVEMGGQQIRVEPGRFYDINYLGVDPDSSYTVDKVLLVNDEEEIRIGQPFIEGAIVEGKILEHRRGRKIIVYKMRPKKKTRKKRGHRQELSRLMITAIKIDDKVIAEDSEGVPVVATEITTPAVKSATEEE
ncbi:50S ribosomal protein L21 [cyanobacterium endosymbiont of Epithemia clementina EcSB]|uniref:50S ribosomal protein L21 n=1 Tax=cyanobacterium endosymbiont of Epithemia clementina EcSB TaxID=3034674 RepID=UPI00247FDD25|nr:50S ribosomal protein L21 [cyanobacterium endosymbiont of Epithemia clementina EcSB]WGT67182.1 50S ribosomal protein L21 [cyanobacterium endosymbiont of Epithemia clementina EcSB]